MYQISETPFYLQEAICDAAERTARRLAATGECGTASSVREHTKVWCFTQEFSTTSGMFATLDDDTFDTHFVIVIWPGFDLPAYCYDNGRFVYELEMTEEHEKWVVNNSMPTLSCIEHLTAAPLVF